MPSGDRTGPMGQGPMTGRAAGYCAGYDTPGYMKGFGGGMGRGFGFGRGMGRAMGRGRGFGRGYYCGIPFTGGYFHPRPWQLTLSKEEEIKMLKSQAEVLNRTAKDIEKRISELENLSK